jgi:hypothetical protein
MPRSKFALQRRVGRGAGCFEKEAGKRRKALEERRSPTKQVGQRDALGQGWTGGLCRQCGWVTREDREPVALCPATANEGAGLDLGLSWVYKPWNSEGLSISRQGLSALCWLGQRGEVQGATIPISATVLWPGDCHGILNQGELAQFPSSPSGRVFGSPDGG